MRLHAFPILDRLIFRRRSETAEAIWDSRCAGFTLLELIIVITIIMILAGIAGVRYERSVTRSKEAVLKTDLATMRNAIQSYTLDKEAGPSSLEDLVQAKYLSKVPTDPLTHGKLSIHQCYDQHWDPIHTIPSSKLLNLSAVAGSSDGRGEELTVSR